MRLVNYLKKHTQKKLKVIADTYNIYYETDFSKRWLSEQIKDKLTNELCFNKIIKNNLSTSTQESLKEIVINSSINQKKIDQQNYNQLTKLGLIYRKNNRYYLPQDIQYILKKHFKKATKPKPKTFKKKITNKIPSLLKQEIIINTPPNLDFFQYLILTLAYLDKLNQSNISKKQAQQELIIYLDQINSTDLETKRLFNYIFSYSQSEKIINLTSHQLTTKFKNWLNTPYSQLLINSLDNFFPENSNNLRMIIAVLTKFNPHQGISVDFIKKEFDFNLEEESNLLSLLNIFNITNEQLKLTTHFRNLLNTKNKEENIKLKVTKDKIIVKPSIQLNQLWHLSQLATLVEVDTSLKFKLNQKKNLINETLEEKYPKLKKLRLERLQGKYQHISKEDWKKTIERFKINHNIKGKDSLGIDLSY